MSTSRDFAFVFRLLDNALWRMPLITRWIRFSTSKMIHARQTRHSPRKTSASRAFDSRWISHVLRRRKFWRRLNVGENIACLFPSCWELHLSPFEHNPLAFHFQHSRCSLWTRYCPLRLKRLMISLISCLKIQWFQILLNISFYHCLQSQISLSSNEYLNCKIQTRSWIFQTLAFSICTNLKKHHQIGISSSTTQSHPISYRIPDYLFFRITSRSSTTEWNAKIHRRNNP